MSKGKRSFANDGRGPIGITPVFQVKEARAPMTITPAPQNLERGRAPITTTPASSKEDRGRQPTTITPVPPPAPPPKTDTSGGSTGKK
jgi:hypothetical protein